MLFYRIYAHNARVFYKTLPPFGKREILTREKRVTYKALLTACGGGIDPPVSFADSPLSQKGLYDIRAYRTINSSFGALVMTSA